VDDILGEGSDDSDSEKKRPPPREPQATPEATLETTPCSGRTTAGSRGPRGHKRKLPEEDAGSASSGESSGEDEEGSSSEADEMAAALEAELNDLM